MLGDWLIVRGLDDEDGGVPRFVYGLSDDICGDDSTGGLVMVLAKLGLGLANGQK